MSDPYGWDPYADGAMDGFGHDPYALTDPALPGPEDEGWWPAQSGERDEHGELVESLPETAELREWWPGDRREDAS